MDPGERPLYPSKDQIRYSHSVQVKSRILIPYCVCCIPAPVLLLDTCEFRIMFSAMVRDITPVGMLD